MFKLSICRHGFLGVSAVYDVAFSLFASMAHLFVLCWCWVFPSNSRPVLFPLRRDGWMVFIGARYRG